METIFKVGDKVFDIRYGWGTVYKTLASHIVVSFDFDMVSYDLYGIKWNEKIPSLSFTEYDLIKGGLSQERPIEIPKQGQLVYVKDYEEHFWEMRYFSHYKDNMFHCFLNQKKGNNTNPWKYCVTKNPLEND